MNAKPAKPETVIVLLGNRYHLNTGDIGHPWTFSSEAAAKEWFTHGGWALVNEDWLKG